VNFLRFTYRFISRKGSSTNFNWTLIFPIIGIVVGCTLVTLTFAIMDGMEEKIFSSLRKFSSPAKITIDKSDIDNIKEVEEFLVQNQIKYFNCIERNGILSNEDDYRFSKIRAVHNLEDYLKSLGLTSEPNDYGFEDDTAILGNGLARRLNLEVLDDIKLISPLDVNMFTGVPPIQTIKLYDTFVLDILDYDYNYAFIQYKTGQKIFRYSKNMLLLLSDKIELTKLNEFLESFPNVRYSTWEDDQHKLISAMKLEKIAYTTFGFLIVFIAGFNLLSLMSLSVMQKIPQIGILKTIGYSNSNISMIFVVQSLATGFLGGIFGIGFAVGLIKLETEFNFMKVIFDTFPLKEFPLILSPEKLVFIFTISVLLIVIAGIYPAYKSAKLNPVKSIDYIK